jgi:hypothetical protein
MIVEVKTSTLKMLDTPNLAILKFQVGTYVQQ